MTGEQFEEIIESARQALAGGDAAAARQQYLQALGEQTDSPDAHYGLATACFLLGDLESAAVHFKEVTRVDPLRAGAYINLGAVYNRLDQLDEAIKALRRGIQLDNQRAEGFYNLGLAYRRKGEAELAIQAYREATHLNPRMGDAHYNLANLLSELGRYSQAITHYKEALAINPKFEKAKFGIEQAEAGLKMADAPDKPETHPDLAITPPPATPPPRPAADLNRMVDPLADGAVLSALHETTKEAEGHGRKFAKILESEIEPAIKELSTALLYPDKAPSELSERIHRFEAAMADMRTVQKHMQQSMKKLRELGDRLAT